VLAERASGSAWGTAAQASFWVALEQPGPWGRDAASESHLDPATGAALSAACADRGGRLALLRTPGRHADDHHRDGTRTAYLAWSGAGPWLVRARVRDPASLHAVLDAVAAGDQDAALAAVPEAALAEPVLLVCTNGRRDVCCAIRGRPIALEAAAFHPGRVWEASHTGGHRFAPTGVLLPHGQTLARLDARLATRVLDAADAGSLPPEVPGSWHDRGRSSLEPGAQAAEAFVREHISEPSLTALSTSGADGRYAVRHRDGRVWEVRCTRVTTGERRPESCGKADVDVADWQPEWSVGA
jgi:hypothetical protein